MPVKLDLLPEELLLHVFAFLDVLDVLSLQTACHRLYKLGRDNNSWKHRCFEDSRAEANRRRQQLLSQQDERLAHLRQAINESAGSLEQRITQAVRITGSDEDEQQRLKARALINWDPTYPGENLNFYQEYVQRHAPVWTHWFHETSHDSSMLLSECVGAAIVSNHEASSSQKVLSQLEDGSVCIYNLGTVTTGSRRQSSMIRQTAPGLLFDAQRRGRTSQQDLSRETESTDNVSVDASQDRAYIATLNQVSELDLNTFQVIRRSTFPFSVSTLSAAEHPTPITIGTSSTLHLLDPRASRTPSNTTDGVTARCELIGGLSYHSLLGNQPQSTEHATLSQPGPSSILHDPSKDHDIWIAGRFTSLLHYDRRYWPRISNTIFSGSRLSSLAMIPHPFVPHAGHLSVDLISQPTLPIKSLVDSKAASGITLIAGGEYKGKGSLELYGLSQSGTPATNYCYRNRQTASKSRVLSVAPHGGRIVFSDGDGNLKWSERDGKSIIRTFNINTDDSPGAEPNTGGIFANQDLNSDIVRKIIPRITGRNSPPAATSQPRLTNQLNHDDLLLWTGDGRLGLLGFGSHSGETAQELHVAAEDAEVVSRHIHEREYERTMREALERQADDARWVRGLGLGY